MTATHNAQTIAAPPAQRLVALNGLRGIAALVVVLFHYTMAYRGSPLPASWSATPLSLLWDGSAAVSVFFVLSGFVLAYGYMQAGDGRPLHVRSFYGSRALRLLGPYIGAFLLSTLCVHFLFSHQPGGEWRTRAFVDTWIRASSLTPAEFIGEALLLEPAFAYHTMVQAWTLSVELYLSLLFPALLTLLRRSPALFVVALLSIPLICRLWATQPYPLLASGVLHFMLGMVLARYYDSLPHLAVLRRTWSRLLLFAIGLACLSVRSTINAPLRILNPFGVDAWNIAAFGAFVIVGAALVSAPLQRLLSTPLMTGLGRISYSLYLLHIAVLYLLVPPALQWLAAQGLGMPALWLAGLVVAVVCSLAAAELFHRAVERPCLDGARRIARRRAG